MLKKCIPRILLSNRVYFYEVPRVLIWASIISNCETLNFRFKISFLVLVFCIFLGHYFIPVPKILNKDYTRNFLFVFCLRYFSIQYCINVFYV